MPDSGEQYIPDSNGEQYIPGEGEYGDAYSEYEQLLAAAGYNYGN